MIIEYSPLPGIKNVVPQPIVPIIFINKNLETATFALVDSGAAGAVISTVIAEDLGIDWQKIPKKNGLSVGGNFYSHETKIEARVFDEKFGLTISIIEGLAPYKAILGQKDLFQRAKITFEAYKKQFRIDFRQYN